MKIQKVEFGGFTTHINTLDDLTNFACEDVKGV